MESNEKKIQQEEKQDSNSHLNLIESDAYGLGFSKVFEHAQDVENNEALKEILQKTNNELLKVTPISPELHHEFKYVVQAIDNLVNNIQLKKVAIVEKVEEIKVKVQALVASELVKIDEREYQKSEESVAQYAQLLDGICQELVTEKNLCEHFVGDTLPEVVVIGKGTASSFIDVARYKIKAVKHHLKTIERDLSISYSRYSFGFDSQLKRIAYVQSALKKYQTQK